MTDTTTTHPADAAEAAGPDLDAVEAADDPFAGDLFTVTTTRYAWEEDSSYADKLDRARATRNAKVEAFARLVARVGEHDLPMPTVSGYAFDNPSCYVTASYHVDELVDMRRLARAIRQATGVNVSSKANKNGSLTASVEDGPLLWEVSLTADASPCEQVQVGVETKVEREEVAPPRYREVEKEVPVYEWRCPPSILDNGDEAAAALDADEADEPEGDTAGEPA